MSDTKVFSFPEGGTGGKSDLLAILPALLNQRGIDPAVLPFLNNDRKSGTWGEDIIGLIVLLAVLNGGVGGFGGFGGNRGGFPNQLNNDANTATIMQAVTRNGFDINTLSTALNTSSDAIIGAINALSGQICNVANQMGQNTNQVLTALLQGNNAITSQICSCCCDLKQLISESNYLTERGFNNTNTILAKGFCDLGYASQTQTCELKGAIKDSTEAILAGQRAAEMREMQREITERDRKIAEQNNAINNYQQTQTFAAMLNNATAPIAAAVNGLQSDVDGIKCRLPKTEVIPATPEYVAVNRSINVPYTPYCTTGFGFGTFNNGCCGNGSLWG